MGDWYIGPNGRWVYDPNAPAPSVEHTAMMPAVPKLEDEFAELYEREDGSIYGRVDPEQFENFDEVDSRTIVDHGGPPDAA